MNILKKIYCRTFQFALKIGMYFIPFPSPEIISGENSTTRIKDVLIEKKINNVLIVTDKNLYSLGLLNKMIESFKESNIKREDISSDTSSLYLVVL